jgi:hypothetical protein
MAREADGRAQQGEEKKQKCLHAVGRMGKTDLPAMYILASDVELAPTPAFAPNHNEMSVADAGRVQGTPHSIGRSVERLDKRHDPALKIYCF